MVAVPALDEVVPEALDPDGLPIQDGPRVEMVVDPEALIAARVRVSRVRAVGCRVARAAAARPARVAITIAALEPRVGGSIVALEVHNVAVLKLMIGAVSAAAPQLKTLADAGAVVHHRGSIVQRVAARADAMRVALAPGAIAAKTVPCVLRKVEVDEAAVNVAGWRRRRR